MDEVFKALADPSRRALLDSLNMARQCVSKHLAVLEEAGLVATVQRGREKLHYLNAAPVQEIAHRWISHYDRARVQALADLKLALEETPSSPDRAWPRWSATAGRTWWRA
jgi:predicted ArsR family transcriptional regulator